LSIIAPTFAAACPPAFAETLNVFVVTLPRKLVPHFFCSSETLE
jgi:hypothetical protein